MVEIVEAKFVTSAPNVASAPEAEALNEVVFMARSNTGKSSLLNALTNHKNLAKVSSTPGKTKLINYFDVTFIDRETNNKLQAKFVDLPGFGYAKVSKSQKKDWEKNLTDFITKRKSIKIFIQLIDSRHPNLEIDKDVAEFLKAYRLEHQHIIQVFTKIDKLKQKEINALKKAHPGVLMVSSSKKRGIKELTKIIYEILLHG